ncbi:MFS transporter [Loktanella sp. F6476L]|uniref:MFS transporter n=1 Tax=Loktanella sp. F6476L TaxID=2926405 RepID=UPI001FF61289|nr:MFS transporter [Loktanella sp. F6476L]MCK0119021.1 MFS transporter [Loktanella sp. F6476L]
MTDYTETAPARLATRLAFLVAGFAMACCAPLFPFIKANVGADEGQFGLLLLCLGLGSIVAMPVTGVIAARRGARLMILCGGFGLIAMLPLLALVNTPIGLGVTLFVFGASIGTLDVAMNVHGAEVEGREGRPLMSNFHAQFSIGSLVGAAMVTVLLSVGVPIPLTALIGAVLAGGAMLHTRTRLLSVSGNDPEPFAAPRGVVLLLAALAAITFLVEGAVLDWGALLVIERDLSTAKNAGIGYILFSVAMVIARLGGDRIIRGLGEFRVLIAGGMITICGVALILLADAQVAAFAGFVLIGLGAANLVPIFFSAAGRQTIMPAGLAIASVTTTGYAGVLLGPALIGFTADATSLPSAFWLVAALMAAVPLTAQIVVRK